MRKDKQNMELLLSEFREMRKSVNGTLERLGKEIAEHSDLLAEHGKEIEWHDECIKAIDKGLRHNIRFAARTNKAVALQQEQIDELSRRVDRLIAGGHATVWEKDNQVGLERRAFQRTAECANIPYSAALSALDDTGRLLRANDGKPTRPVRRRKDGKVVRAVVVLAQEDKETD